MPSIHVAASDRKDKAVSDNILDQTETKAVLADEISDEALEAAAEKDRRLGAITLGSPIWCPDPSGGPRRELELAA
jgi:hypothetical protein